MRRSRGSDPVADPGGAAVARLLRSAVLCLGCSIGGLLMAPHASGAPTRTDDPHHAADARNSLTAADFKQAPKDLVLWGDLARAGVTRSGGRFHVTFLPPVRALDGKTVTLVGFMAPVHAGKRHTQFLLSDRRFLCDACEAPPPPQSLVEINTRVAEPARERPIIVRGSLELVRDDPNGLIYRLTDAKVLRRQP
jgi:hypothetical protein